MPFILALMLVLGAAQARDLHSIEEKSIEGKVLPLKSFQGKILLIVNIASQCGLTPQLEQLETLYDKYKKEGLVVLGVPSNDFLGQSPENDQEMLEFCQKNYKTSFPLLTKGSVKGDQKRELYKYLTEESPKEYRGDVRWNFDKFLVNGKGDVVGRMGPRVKPLDSEVVKAIEKALKTL